VRGWGSKEIEMLKTGKDGLRAFRGPRTEHEFGQRGKHTEFKLKMRKLTPWEANRGKLTLNEQKKVPRNGEEAIQVAG